jgi:hypothetical protein
VGRAAASFARCRQQFAWVDQPAQGANRECTQCAEANDDEGQAGTPCMNRLRMRELGHTSGLKVFVHIQVKD